jgi:copper(I)-binding protein
VRRSLLLAATLGTVLLAGAGCGAGQISQTADIVPAVPGANSTATPGGDASIQLRNALIAYPGLDGYRAGAAAPLELSVFNTGDDPVTLVQVTTEAARSVTLETNLPPSASPSGSASATASPSAPASANGRVRVTVPVGGYVTLTRSAGTWLQLTGLTKDLRPGEAASVRFTFDNGASYTLDVPMGMPTQPAPTGSPVGGEGTE